MFINAPTEIISIEIKTESSNKAVFTGLGQVVMYKLFSNKCYLVIPEKALKSKRERLIASCINEGIGLITFKEDNPEKPNWEVVQYAASLNPHPKFANEIAEKIVKIALSGKNRHLSDLFK